MYKYRKQKININLHKDQVGRPNRRGIRALNRLVDKFGLDILSKFTESKNVEEKETTTYSFKFNFSLNILDMVLWIILLYFLYKILF